MLCWGQRGTQSVQSLSCKHEDLNLIPEPCQTQDVVPQAYSHNAEKGETGKPLGLLVNQQSQISGFQVKARDCLQQGVHHPEEIYIKSRLLGSVHTHVKQQKRQQNSAMYDVLVYIHEAI